MKKSITSKLKIWMFGFGIFMGIIFPYYAALFDTAGSWNNPLFKGGSFVAGLMIGVFCYAMVRIILLREIQKIDDFSESLKNNDLTASIDIESSDRIGKLVNNLSESTQSIRSLMTMILTTSESVLTSLNQLQNFAGNMNTAAGEISQRSHAMTSTAEMISTNSQNITIKVADTASSVSKISQDVTSLTESLSRVDEKCAEELSVTREVNEQFHQTRDAIVELADNSTAISKITDVIMTIADQTNLLAINAAVEAAAAGQYGKSFAVVANEVKVLADQSLKSAGEISKLIDTIKPIIETSHTAITGSSDKMEKLTVLAQEISTATSHEVSLLKSIEDELGTSNDNMQSVADSVQENNAGITESSDRLRLVNDAISEITRDITAGTKSISTLESMAAELAEMTRQFTI